MRAVFTADLAELGNELTTMGEAVADAIERAGTSFMSGDLDMAQGVIAGDAEIDIMQRHIDERCVDLLAREAPVARDLRQVVAALRITATLERMGDLARHVAEVTRMRYPNQPIPEKLQPVFRDMTAATTVAARQVAELLQSQDMDLASRIESGDDAIDALQLQAMRSMLDTDWVGKTQEAVDVTLVARFLERLGDHAVAVSRRISYLVKGDLAALSDTHDSV